MADEKKDDKKEPSPEEVAEKNKKETDEAINKAVADLLKVEEKHGVETGTILKAAVERIKNIATVAAGANYGASPSEIAELVEKHTPYIVPAEAIHTRNIVDHAPYLEEAGPTAKKAPVHAAAK